ncbi:hypothetical protein E7X58_03180 [Streptomyces sp. A1499]|nr:hypothetical protein E7X58_03180 [Streptomyces sp. A1499]
MGEGGRLLGGAGNRARAEQGHAQHAAPRLSEPAPAPTTTPGENGTRQTEPPPPPPAAPQPPAPPPRPPEPTPPAPPPAPRRTRASR